MHQLGLQLSQDRIRGFALEAAETLRVEAQETA
jgi:hypothetical protein